MRSAFAAAALLVITAACADQVTAPDATTATAKRSAEIVGSGVWAREITGSTGPGSRYAIFVPQDWNGDVVYYAHGIRPAAGSHRQNRRDNFQDHVRNTSEPQRAQGTPGRAG